MIQSTNVRLPKAPTVRPMIDISKFSVGHDFASLKTLNFKRRLMFMDLSRKIRVSLKNDDVDCKLEAVIQQFNSIVQLAVNQSILTNLNERNTDKPCTPSKPNSSNDNATIMKSKMFQPS